MDTQPECIRDGVETTCWSSKRECGGKTIEVPAPGFTKLPTTCRDFFGHTGNPPTHRVLKEREIPQNKRANIQWGQRSR